jgi:hypothetical protein
VNCCVRPLGTEAPAGVTAIDSSAGAVTVSVIEPLIAPDAALMVVVPTASAETMPPVLIVAVPGAPLLQVTAPVMLAVLPSL